MYKSILVVENDIIVSTHMAQDIPKNLEIGSHPVFYHQIKTAPASQHYIKSS